MAVTATILASCGGAKTTTAEADKFDYTVEQFADLQILRYKVPEFETLTLKQKELGASFPAVFRFVFTCCARIAACRCDCF